MGTSAESDRDPVEMPEWASNIPSTTEQLDEDELAADPLEAARDPADDWTGARRYATAPGEQRAGESHNDRLAEEEPDLESEGRGDDWADEHASMTTVREPGTPEAESESPRGLGGMDFR